MKKLSLFLSAFLLMCIISCKDDCEGVVCNDGSCIDGTCLCDQGFYGDNCDVKCTNGVYQNGTCTCLQGYEGAECDVESRTRYYGSWSGVLSGCTVDTPIGDYPVPEFPVTLEITESTENVFTVDVVFGMDNTTATIDGSNFTLNPVNQSFDAGGFPINLTFSGQGTLTSDTQMDMDLDIDVMGTVSTCPMTFTKG